MDIQPTEFRCFHPFIVVEGSFKGGGPWSVHQVPYPGIIHVESKGSFERLHRTSFPMGIQTTPRVIWTDVQLTIRMHKGIVADEFEPYQCTGLRIMKAPARHSIDVHLD